MPHKLSSIGFPLQELVQYPPGDTTCIFQEVFLWKIWDMFLDPCFPRLNGCWNRKKMFNFFQDLSQVEQKPMKIGDLAWDFSEAKKIRVKI